MKTRNELGIKYTGRIGRDEIKPGDIIEIEPEEGSEMNRRYIVNRITPEGMIEFDRRGYHWAIDDENIIGVIRWFPTNDELNRMARDGWIWPLRIDYPDYEREESPVFTYEMLEDYDGVETLLFSIQAVPDREAMDNLRLHNSGYAWNKRWIIWDTLKFYSLSNAISYFI